MNGCRIITWDANSILEKKKEFEVFRRHKRIALPSFVTHFNNRTFFHIQKYTTYSPPHPKALS